MGSLVRRARCGWDFNAPPFGDLAVGDGFQKHSYPFGIMVNARGERFVDEGADFRNYTYAKYGQEILAQPGQFAWQVFDAQRSPPASGRVPDRGRSTKVVGRVHSRNWPRRQWTEVDGQASCANVSEYNAARAYGR